MPGSRRRQRGVLLAGIALLLAALVLAVVLASVFMPGREAAGGRPLRWQDRGTTRNLREIVLGRCYSYLAERHPALGRDTDCLEIWESLKYAFIYKNPCNTTAEDYQPLMELASHPIPCNKSLFWSKTKDLAHRYTKSSHGFLTLEDTLLGYMFDGVSWCGDPSAPGINYESCPKWSECENSPGSVFWKTASKRFAEAACGVVQVILNGSIEAGAFRSSSIFGSIEVFNLNPDKVSEIQIWLMHDIGGPQSESCSGHSIQRLKRILEERNFTITCEDNYRAFHLCCKAPVGCGWSLLSAVHSRRSLLLGTLSCLQEEAIQPPSTDRHLTWLLPRIIKTKQAAFLLAACR